MENLFCGVVGMFLFLLLTPKGTRNIVTIRCLTFVSFYLTIPVISFTSDRHNEASKVISDYVQLREYRPMLNLSVWIGLAIFQEFTLICAIWKVQETSLKIKQIRFHKQHKFSFFFIIMLNLHLNDFRLYRHAKRERMSCFMYINTSEWRKKEKISRALLT